MTTATDIQRGDRVMRRSGRRVVGIVERVFHPAAWTGLVDTSRTLARVRWEGALTPFRGGYADNHSTVSIDSLVLATDEVISARRERAQDLTPMMRRAVSIWRERVGTEWARPREVYIPGEEKRLYNAMNRMVCMATWETCPLAFKVFETEWIELNGKKVNNLRYRLAEES